MGTRASLPEQATLRSFLSTLTLIQGTGASIVMAVTILGVEVVGERYSSRMAAAFYEHPVFLVTVASIASAIGLNLVLLFGISTAGQPVYAGLLFGAVALVPINVLLTFWLVRQALQLNTPEGTTTAYAAQLTVSRVVDQLEQLVDEHGESHHPLLPLQNMAIRSFETGDVVTGRKATERYCDELERLSCACLGPDGPARLGAAAKERFVRPVVETHLPKLIEEATAAEQRELVDRLLKLYEDVAVNAIDRSDRSQLLAFVQLGEFSSALPQEDSETVAAAWDRLGNVLRRAAEDGSPEEVRRLLATMDTPGGDRLGEELDVGNRADIRLRYVADLRKTHRALCRAESGASALADCVDEMCVVTAGLVTDIEELSTDDSGLAPGTVAGEVMDRWCKVCHQAFENSSPDHQRRVARVVWELSFVLPLEAEDTAVACEDALHRTYNSSGEAVVADAYEHMVAFEPRETAATREPVQFGDRNRRYENEVQVESYVPLNGHEQFPERLEQLRMKLRR